MAVFMNDDGVVQVAVAIGRGVRENVLLHPRIRAVRRRAEVRVVPARAVLGIDADAVAAAAQSRVVDLLEVPGRLVESQSHQAVVQPVVEVEQVRDRGREVRVGIVGEGK